MGVNNRDNTESCGKKLKCCGVNRLGGSAPIRYSLRFYHLISIIVKSGWFGRKKKEVHLKIEKYCACNKDMTFPMSPEWSWMAKTTEGLPFTGGGNHHSNKLGLPLEAKMVYSSYNILIKSKTPWYMFVAHSLQRECRVIVLHGVIFIPMQAVQMGR